MPEYGPLCLRFHPRIETNQYVPANYPVTKVLHACRSMLPEITGAT
jgi:hypothetical protein